jgi:NAD(P)-dependent dehydrogenase (short-subunit alcohol dehydrogenase family)
MVRAESPKMRRSYQRWAVLLSLFRRFTRSRLVLMMKEPVSTARLDDKVAIVTGAGRGIGAGIAIELGARGASVVVNYRSSAEAAEGVVAKIKAAGSDSIAVQGDMSNLEDIVQLFRKAKDHFQKVDIVVSNSGIEHFGEIPKVTAQDFDRVFGLNTRGQFFVAQQAYEDLGDGGRLILTSSISAHVAVRQHALYAGSKCAVEAFARCLAPDFGARGITVNSVAPGGVRTDMAAAVAYRYIPSADASWSIDDIEKFVSSRTPMGRMAYPVDIARVVGFLSSEDAGWISGMFILTRRRIESVASRRIGEVIHSSL